VNTVGDFWRMVWQERSPIVVMITNEDEKNEVGEAWGRGGPLCWMYDGWMEG